MENAVEGGPDEQPHRAGDESGAVRNSAAKSFFVHKAYRKCFFLMRYLC